MWDVATRSLRHLQFQYHWTWDLLQRRVSLAYQAASNAGRKKSGGWVQRSILLSEVPASGLAV